MMYGISEISSLVFPDRWTIHCHLHPILHMKIVYKGYACGLFLFVVWRKGTKERHVKYEGNKENRHGYSLLFVIILNLGWAGFG